MYVFKKLVHVFMEVTKSQDLLSSSRSLRRDPGELMANGTVIVYKYQVGSQFESEELLVLQF